MSKTTEEILKNNIRNDDPDHFVSIDWDSQDSKDDLAIVVKSMQEYADQQTASLQAEVGKLKEENSKIKATNATLLNANQDLITRLSGSYFKVMKEAYEAGEVNRSENIPFKEWYENRNKLNINSK